MPGFTRDLRTLFNFRRDVLEDPTPEEQDQILRSEDDGPHRVVHVALGDVYEDSDTGAIWRVISMRQSVEFTFILGRCAWYRGRLYHAGPDSLRFVGSAIKDTFRKIELPAGAYGGALPRITWVDVIADEVL